jgi:hypothetical protein
MRLRLQAALAGRLPCSAACIEGRDTDFFAIAQNPIVSPLFLVDAGPGAIRRRHAKESSVE